MTRLSDHISAAVAATESGVFTWTLATNTFFADAKVASFFEIAPELAEQGLPLECYLERIHSDDRPGAAKTIHDTIVNGGPCHQEYRLTHEDQSIIHVLAIGHCFRNKQGVPSDYAGTIYNMTAAADASVDRTISDLCVAAYRLSSESDDRKVHELLRSVLVRLGTPVELIGPTASSN